LEEGWESDEEEEAFVDSLALSLTDDSMDVPIDLDDEDPDTEDWDDLKPDDENDDEAEEEIEEDLRDSASDDEFLDEVENGDDDYEEEEGEFLGIEGQDGRVVPTTAFMTTMRILTRTLTKSPTLKMTWQLRMNLILILLRSGHEKSELCQRLPMRPSTKRLSIKVGERRRLQGNKNTTIAA